MAETLIERAAIYLGRQEVFGPNDGPNIRRWKQAMGPGLPVSAPLPWRGIFPFNMLLERNKIERRYLVAALGFRPGKFFPESCTSWLEEVLDLQKRGMPPVLGEAIPALAPTILVEDPRPNDIFLLAKRLPDGTYSATEMEHMGICTSLWLPTSPRLVGTIEGNTVSGEASDCASREGNGVYRRQRVGASGKLRFIRPPVSLTGFKEVVS